MDLLRLPDINAPDPEGQIQQVRDYLNELAAKMNYNLWLIEKTLTEKENKNG